MMNNLKLDEARLFQGVADFIALCHKSTLGPTATVGGAFRIAGIPSSLRDSPKNKAGYLQVRLSNGEARAYNHLLAWLGQLRETEWLSPEQLDKTLWALACEVAISPEDLETDLQRNIRAKQFLPEVLRDIRLYEVVFTLDHIDPPISPVPIWDVAIIKATSDVMEPFVERSSRELQEFLCDPFLGKAILLMRGEGTAAAHVLERARVQARHRLHVLRSGLARHWQTRPEQLHFSLGEYAFARALSGPPDTLRVEQPLRTVPLAFHPGLTERLVELQKVCAELDTGHSSVRAPVERACEWIGRGLCRRWPGDALRDYTTALEVLLAPQGSHPKGARKGVLLSYRMLALADLHGDSMIHPTTIREAYGDRCVIVHEGREEAGDEPSTRSMLSGARDCVGWLASFAAGHPNDDHTTLLMALDTPALRRKAVDWLSRLPDPWSQALSRDIESLPK